MLAEANIDEGRLKKAEDFLIAAYWNLLKHNKNEKQLGDDKGKDDDVLSEAYINLIFMNKNLIIS